MKVQSFIRAAAVAAIASLGLAACGSGGGGGNESSDAAGPLRVTLANHVWTEQIKAAIPEFEKETGIKVELTQLGEDQLSDQYNVKLNAGSEDIDVMMYRPLQEGKLFAKNKYLADLSDNVKKDSSWDWNDFQQNTVAATTSDG